MIGKKKFVIFAAIVLLVITAVVVAFVCFSTNIDKFERTYTMYSLTKTGEKDARYAVTVDAERKDDQISFDFSVMSGDETVLSGKQEYPLNALTEYGADAYEFFGRWYDEKTNGVVFVTFYTDLDFQVFAASYQDRVYIGSTEEDFDMDSVKEALDYQENVFLDKVFGEE